MIIEQVDKTKRDKFRLALERITSTLVKRGVSIELQAQSELVGNITLNVSGKKGAASKNFTIIYNQLTSEWEVYSDGYVHKLQALSEITTVVKNKIQNLSTLLQKL